MSFTKTNWTDPQGNTFDLAYFEIAEANLSMDSRENFRSLFGEEASTTSHSNSRSNYKVYYWASEQAKLDGLPPYILANLSPVGTSFEIANDFIEANPGLSADALAELHADTVTLAV